MAQISKVHYRPIEAAIRWSGLVRDEREILDCLHGRRPSDTAALEQWPTLQLRTERIYDGILNNELRHAVNGVVVQDLPQIDASDLTIRHIDLRAWMQRYYPHHRPRFLFSRIERQLNPVITTDAVQALIIQRDLMQSQLAQRDMHIEALRTHQTNIPPDALQLSQRSEKTYLNIVGGLVNLLLGASPSGQRYSKFETQASVISAMVARQGERLGISERTLAGTFARANRELEK